MLATRPLLFCLGFGAALGLTVAVPAEAQQGFALGQFQPSLAGDRFFGVQSPFAAGDRPTLHVMVLADYAHDPLVLRGARTNRDLGAVVAHQGQVHLNVSLALYELLTLNFDIPVGLQAGDTARLAAPTAESPGDLRVDARLSLVGTYFDAFQLALGTAVWLPTGSRDAYLSDGSVRGGTQLIAGGQSDRFVWSAAAALEFRKAQGFINVASGNLVRWGAAAGVLLGKERRLQLGPELTGSVTTIDVQSRTVNAEWLAGARYHVGDSFEAGAGVGTGFSRGVGTPDFRAVAMIAYSPAMKGALADRDGDGIEDSVDACPDIPGPVNEDPQKSGCPKPRSVDHAGVLPEPPPRPVDRDSDGIPTAVDACPGVPGVVYPDPRNNGCPALLDRDSDGIPDAEDACPDEAGDRNQDALKNGCPGAVRVTGDDIVLSQQVQFDLNQVSIRSESAALLDQIASLLKEHAEFLRIEVQGHTDNWGSTPANMTLSQGRAEEVVKALVQRGVSPARLTAKGYGPKMPLVANVTSQSRQMNRRVAFKVLEKRAK